VDDIIFGGSSHALVAKFSETMSREFEMSMMGELTFFLGLQIKQTREGTFMHQGRYTKDLLRRSCGPEGVPKHDRIIAVPDGDETGHPVRSLLVRTLSVFTAHITSSSRQADHEVPSFHTRNWSLAFGFLLSFSLQLL
jgi:hypothetical protein